MALTASLSVLITPCMLFFLDEGGGVFVWTSPIPAWNQTVSGNDPRNVHTAITSVANGSSNVTLHWSYALLRGQEILTTSFAIYDGFNPPQDFGVVANDTAVIMKGNDYKTRFIIKSTHGEYSLIIKTVTERENVTFQCRVLLTDGSQWAYNIRTQVTVPPRITNVSANMTLDKGYSISLECTAEGFPVPSISWTRLSDNNVVTMPFTISGKEDEGAYRCIANNGIGRLSARDVFITVSSPPEITEPSTALWQITSGDSTSIECQATGNPSPRYVWKNAAGEVVTNGTHLRLNDVGDQDTGTSYTCTAWNRLGAAHLTIVLQVKNRLTSTNQTDTLPATTKIPPEERVRTLSSSGTSRHILIGVSAAVIAIVAAVLGIAVWWWRKENKRQKKEYCRRKNRHQTKVRTDGQTRHYVDLFNSQSNNVHVENIRPPVVDWTKKPGKKPKSGELHYADLGNFQGSQDSLTSPSPPLINKPPPYVKTEYAEITEFHSIPVSPHKEVHVEEDTIM